MKRKPEICLECGFFALYVENNIRYRICLLREREELIDPSEYWMYEHSIHVGYDWARFPPAKSCPFYLEHLVLCQEKDNDEKTN